jgi:hypothetical protein
MRIFNAAAAGVLVLGAGASCRVVSCRFSIAHLCPSSIHSPAVKASIFGSSPDLEAVGRFADDNPMSIVYNGVSVPACLICCSTDTFSSPWMDQWTDGWTHPLNSTASKHAHRKARQPRKVRRLNRCHHWRIQRSRRQGAPSRQCGSPWLRTQSELILTGLHDRPQLQSTRSSSQKATMPR